ncbi:hypothetical protein PVK06_035405 [Gossypium arboreum]|uniref:Uncharacterized protein n=1 Tax=Gossypium arboreum TaxID=29729 RepID=A0ABR0NIU7_GOSAR|nr:hypothetical protein PVK06_035405 [Gossypium arboreum]
MATVNATRVCGQPCGWPYARDDCVVDEGMVVCSTRPCGGLNVAVWATRARPSWACRLTQACHTGVWILGQVVWATQARPIWPYRPHGCVGPHGQITRVCRPIIQKFSLRVGFAYEEEVF